MAHFAELESKIDPTGFTSNTHLVVKRVVVVSDWQAPISKPDASKFYNWDEDAYQADNTTGWVEVE